MPPKNSGGSTKFLGGHKVIHRTAQTAFVRVVTPRVVVVLFAYLFRLFLNIYIYFLFPIGFSPLTFYFWSFNRDSRGSVMHILVSISS